MPVLQVYLDVDQDLRPDFCLTRDSMNGLMMVLKRDQDHGWGYPLEILIFVLACTWNIIQSCSPSILCAKVNSLPGCAPNCTSNKGKCTQSHLLSKTGGVREL
ncbi:hypothetical protein AMECASPLE_037129 [Ameca splendens]|uniref:Uncharacterized protein n=1 Tax=Ameca splendens TaxID=208324 RepID=A0ABV1AF73_9TELE